MKFAWFAGCKIPYFLPQYERASRAVLEALEVELVELEMNCCGYPVRHQSFEAFILSAARNSALAQARGLDILTPCKCCFGSLKQAEYWLRESDSLRAETNRQLDEEDLRWEGAKIRIRHLLSVMAEDVGIAKIRAKRKHVYDGLKVAAHYGCHALRPANVVRFDNPLAPTLFEKLVDATGAQSVDWPRRLDCCGSPLWEKNQALALELMRKKLEDALQAGAQVLCTACTYCQIQFDTVRAAELNAGGLEGRLPSILYPQLLGLCLGLSAESLGLADNRLDASLIRNYLG
ncbi:MAG: CoB--CoM heterodisulfide reductase iron-sulfur subunit B family protein [Desulfobacterales bacterium]|nr:MAG: CoB--CoM heterodisulfide reductase iron-sulfur subunit B family protein [Desulfobacterales bacterium]